MTEVTPENERAPTVSIILPFKNSENFLSEAIESVLEQSLKDWELICIDDGSTDSSVDIVKRHQSNHPAIQLISLKNSVGAGGARNHGLTAARGKFVAFVDSDDVWDKRKLERQLAIMEETPADFSFHGYYLCDEALHVEFEFKVPKSVTLEKFVTSCPISMCATMVRMTPTAKAIRFSNLKIRNDLEYFISLFEAGVTPVGFSDPLLYVRLRKGSLSRNKFEVARFLWLIARQRLRMPLPKAIFLFSVYMFRGTHKYFGHFARNVFSRRNA